MYRKSVEYEMNIAWIKSAKLGKKMKNLGEPRPKSVIIWMFSYIFKL